MLEAMIGGTPNKAFSYIGSLSEAEFMTYTNLTTVLAPEAAFTKATGFKFFSFRRAGKVVVVPSHAIGRASFKSIYEKGAVYGDGTIGPDTDASLSAASINATVQNKTITVNGVNYIVRLMKGTPAFTYNGLDNNPLFDPATEWEDFAYNLYSNMTSSVTIPHKVVPNADKVTRGAVTTAGRLWTLVQGLNLASGVKRAIGRGRWDITLDYDYANAQVVGNNASINIDASSSAGSVWHPVFEKI